MPAATNDEESAALTCAGEGLVELVHQCTSGEFAPCRISSPVHEQMQPIQHLEEVDTITSPSLQLHGHNTGSG